MVDTTSSWLDIGTSIESWRHLAGIVEKYRANTWLFRGVVDAQHKLIPTIGRPGARKDMDTGADLPFDETAELAMLSRFRREGRPHVATARRSDMRRDWDL